MFRPDVNLNPSEIGCPAARNSRPCLISTRAISIDMLRTACRRRHPVHPRRLRSHISRGGAAVQPLVVTTLFFDYLRRGRMNVARQTSRTVSPVDAVHVYETLLAGPTGDIGIVFDWTEIGDPRI